MIKTEIILKPIICDFILSDVRIAERVGVNIADGSGKVMSSKEKVQIAFSNFFIKYCNFMLKIGFNNRKYNFNLKIDFFLKIH